MAMAFGVPATACGGDGPPEVTRTIELGLSVDDGGDRYRYVADGPVDIRAGDQVTFVLTNTGALVHDLHVVDESGTTIAEAAPIAPGAETQLTVHVVEPGLYRLNCLVDDHLTAHRMQSVVEVTEPSG